MAKGRKRSQKTGDRSQKAGARNHRDWPVLANFDYVVSGFEGSPHARPKAFEFREQV
jgi:hypothetical protein